MSGITSPKYRSIILLAVSFVVIRTLSSCVSQIIRDIISTRPSPEPKDFCQQAEPFDASNWTAAYDIDGFEAKAAELLGGAVRIPTVSVEGTGSVGDGKHWIVFDKLHKYLEENFPRVHELLSLEKVNTYGLLYVWKGSDSTLKPMVLMGHQDVVPVDPQTVNQWRQPPFSGYYDRTRIWGRGSGDDKSGLISILATVESLLERGFQPTRTLILAFGYDEEIGGPRGAQFLAERIFNIYGEDGIALIVDEGDTAGSVVTDKGVPIARPAVGEKGSITVSIEVKTPGGHSSVPPAHTDHPYGVELHRTNPMYALLQCEAAYATPDAMLPRLRQAIKRSLVSDGALELVNEIMSSDRVWRAFVGTTQAVDVIHGGVKSNALPEQATAIVNHRIAIESSYVDVQDHLGAMLAEWGGAFNLSVEAFGKDMSEGKPPFYGSINVTSVSNGHDAAPLSPTDSEAKPWKVLSGSIRGAYRDSKYKLSEGDIIVAPALMTGNTDTRHYWKLSKHIFRYNHHFASDLYNGAHTVNEAYKASGLVEMIKFFTTLIINADQSEAL